MKIFLNVSRWLVGLLFIFSGLVKANDPLGLSYKMQEFFEIWNEGLEKGSFFLNHSLINLFQYLHDHSLALSVIMIAFEIIAGMALLLGWRLKIFSWLLLILIVFFTFLTGYAFLSGKFKNCGCFGDCLPITPLTSFLKDVLLTLLILFLFYHRKKIKPLFNRTITNILMLLVTVISFAIQWYTLNYLPFRDCLPFKTGNTISEQMKIPPGALPDSFAIRFRYEKAGKTYEFSPTDLPADLATYTFKDRVDKLIRKGNAEPPLKGFALTTSDQQDSTEVILNDPGYSIFYFTDGSENEWTLKDGPGAVLNLAAWKGIHVYALTTNADELKKKFADAKWNFPVFNIDYTVFRTAARTNPCIYLIKNGKVVNKWPLKKASAALHYIEKLKP